jgi:zinc transporter ZupT
MFEGKKTSRFWIGISMLGASLGYFCIFIYNTVTSALRYPAPLGEYLTFAFPFLTGAIVFMIISLFMMQSGRRQQLEKKHSRRYWIGLTTLGIASTYLLVNIWIGLVYYRHYSPLTTGQV